MTRINCIPPEYMLDEHVQAHLREGLRPLNKRREGKYRGKSNRVSHGLGKGHELWASEHLIFTVGMWKSYKVEWDSRGFRGYDYDPDYATLVDTPYWKDYKPTNKDCRHNLARVCARWRKRKGAYHFHGKPIDTYADFMVYLGYVKGGLKL